MKKLKLTALALVLTTAAGINVTMAQAVTRAEHKAERAADKTGAAIKRGAQKTGDAVEKGAKAVGHKTAEVAVKGASKVADETYKGRMAPDGSNVYIDGNKRTYYVNKRGGKVYIKESQMRRK